MKVATRVANIKPRCDVHLCGYIGEARKNIAEGIHDDPLAVSILLEINDVKMLFMSIDVIMIEEEKVMILKNRISDATGIDLENIIITAIHSHSLANGFANMEVFGTPDNPTYFHNCCDEIVNSLINIEKDLQIATCLIGTTNIQGFFSKRTDANAIFDDLATVIKFLSNNKIVASMCTFNCHATVLGPENMMLSADIIGAVRNELSNIYGVIPLTFTGASGDISNRQFREGNDFKELDRVGKGIASIINDIDIFEKVSLEPVSSNSYNYRVNYDNTIYFDKYRKEIEEANLELQNKNIPYDVWKLRTSEICTLKMKLEKEIVDFSVKGKVLHLGDLSIVTFPGELANQLGYKLRENSKSKYFIIIGYADDYQGYFIEEEDYGLTYESKASNTPKGVPEKIVEMIGELL